MGTDYTLAQLLGQLSDLETELENLQEQCQAAGKFHGEQCSTSLREGLLQLSVLIQSVKKADTKLIAWYGRRYRLKSALGLLNDDQRIESVVEEETARLKIAVSSVEQNFHDTEELFADGIDTTASLKVVFADFSISSIGSASRLINSICQKWECRGLQTREKIGDQEVLNREAKDLRNVISDKTTQTRTKRSAAETTREDCSTASNVMYAAAAATAASSVFFPAMALVSGAFVLFGRCAAVQASDSDSQAQILKHAEEALTRDLDAAETKVVHLKQKQALLESQEREYIQAQDTARLIQSQTLSLRNEAHETVENLNQARMGLSSTREKIHIIAEQLNEAQYAGSRREISGRLREVLVIIQGIGRQRHMTLDSTEVEVALDHLLAVDDKTSQVLQILEAAKT